MIHSCFACCTALLRFPDRGPLAAICKELQRLQGLTPHHQRQMAPEGFSGIKVSAALACALAAAAVDLEIRAGDTNESVNFRCPVRANNRNQRDHFTSMNSAEFQGQVERDPRLAELAASALPAWLWSADGARILWANPAGALCSAPDSAELAVKNFRARRSAPAPGDAAREPLARQRRSANGAVARLWRGARHADHLRLFAARFSRRPSRRAGGRRRDGEPQAAAVADSRKAAPAVAGNSTGHHGTA